MPRVFHISDLHLSFDDDGNILKPMDHRKWAIGSPSYDGYLEKISVFSDHHLLHSDFVVISGDISHEMNHDTAHNNLRWIRNNIRGTIVVIRGNHDKKFRFNDLRQEVRLDSLYLIDEDEIISIGPYTFMCCNAHKNKEGEFDSDKYIKRAPELVRMAKDKCTVPIIISHYPVSRDIAEKVGVIGVKAFLSGHIHCTQAGGICMSNYDRYVKETDNKKLNGCFFSTATTDILLAQGKEIFKHIGAVMTPTISKDRRGGLKIKCVEAIKSDTTMREWFDIEDPLNKGNTLAGFISASNHMAITHVNGIRVPIKVIYSDNLEICESETVDMNIENPKVVILQDYKENKVCVTMFSYSDALGNVYVTARENVKSTISTTTVDLLVSRPNYGKVCASIVASNFYAKVSISKIIDIILVSEGKGYAPLMNKEEDYIKVEDPDHIYAICKSQLNDTKASIYSDKKAKLIYIWDETTNTIVGNKVIIYRR